MLARDNEKFRTRARIELTTVIILYRTFQPLNQGLEISFVPGEHGFSSFQVENVHWKCMCAAH